MVTKLCICLYAGPRNHCSPLISPRNTGSSQRTLIKHDDVLDLSNISARNNEVFFDWTLSDEPCIGKTRPNATPLHLAVRLATTKSRNCFSSVVVNLADNQRIFPLLRAAYKSDHAMIKLLLSNGANQNVVDLDLQGPCVTLEALGCLQGLVKSGADLALRDKWRTHHFGLCSCVWRHGCLRFSRHERIQDLWWGGNPLIGALKSSSSSLPTFLLNYAPDLDLWIH